MNRPRNEPGEAWARNRPRDGAFVDGSPKEGIIVLQGEDGGQRRFSNGGRMPQTVDVGQEQGYSALAQVHQQLADAHRDLRKAYSELEHSNLSLAEKARRLKALLDVARSITSDLDLGKILDHTISISCRLLGTDCCSIRILDRDRNELVMRASSGLSKSYLRKGSVKVGESVAGVVVRESKPRIVNDMQHNSNYRYPEYAASEGLRSLLCVPLLAKGIVIGVLTVYWKKLHEFGDEEVTMMEAIADLSGVAIATADTHEELERTHQQLSSIYSLTRDICSPATLDRVLDIVNGVIAEELRVERVAILLKQSAAELVVRAVSGPQNGMKVGSVVRIGEDISGWVARDGQSLLINDVSAMEQRPHGWRHLRSILSVALKARGEVLGVITVANALNGNGFCEADREFLEALAGGAAMSIHAAGLYSQLQQNYVDIVTSLAVALESRDRYTKGHSERVSWLAAETAHRMELDDNSVEFLRQAGRLHDIGKIGWTDLILSKNGPLTDEEWGQVRQHPAVGSQIVSAADIISAVAPLVMAHHERIDGSGYPRKLKGDDIPLGARIVAVADSYDAMRSERPYRSAPKSERETRAELIRNANVLYEPVVVEAFLRTLRGVPVEEWELSFK